MPGPRKSTPAKPAATPAAKPAVIPAGMTGREPGGNDELLAVLGDMIVTTGAQLGARLDQLANRPPDRVTPDDLAERLDELETTVLHRLDLLAQAVDQVKTQIVALATRVPPGIAGIMAGAAAPSGMNVREITLSADDVAGGRTLDDIAADLDVEPAILLGLNAGTLDAEAAARGVSGAEPGRVLFAGTVLRVPA